MSKFGTWNQRLQICLIVKSSEEEKCPNLGPKMPYLGVFRPELKEKLLSYLKPAPLNLPKCKISWNN